MNELLGILLDSERALADGFERVAERHRKEPDVLHECKLMAKWSGEKTASLTPATERYGAKDRDEPERIEGALFRGKRSGGLGLLRDLQDLWILAQDTHINWEVLHQAAQGLRDRELEEICARQGTFTDKQLAWLRTIIDRSAAQALMVPT